MSGLLAGSITGVWLTLMVITGASWWLGTSATGSTGSGAAILAMALFKARLVIIHFMEVGAAPLPLRLACEAWVLGTGVLLIGLDALA